MSCKQWMVLGAAAWMTGVMCAGCGHRDDDEHVWLEPDQPIAVDDPVVDPVEQTQGVNAGVAYRELARAHNRRISRFRFLSSQGVVELRWQDEDGDEHLEPQVDMSLYLELPRETALSMQKLGDNIFWIGSDDEQFWFFDLHGEPSTLYLGRWDEVQRGRLEGIAALHPAVMLDLIGVSKLPEQNGRGAQLQRDRDGNPVVEVDRVGATVKMFFDQQWLPQKVELFDDAGALQFTSTLAGYESVFVPGIPTMEFPKLPRLIDMVSAAGDVKIKMALDGPTCDPRGKPFDRVFDLTKLRDHLNPQQVEQLRQP